MKLNTSDTDSLLEKGFTKYRFNSEKILWCQVSLSASVNINLWGSLVLLSSVFIKIVSIS